MATQKHKHSDSEGSARQKDVSIVIDDERVVTVAELMGRLTVGRTTIFTWVRQGKFPPPIQLGPGRIGWRWSRVLQWMSEREANPSESRTYFGRNAADAR